MAGDVSGWVNRRGGWPIINSQGSINSILFCVFSKWLFTRLAEMRSRRSVSTSISCAQHSTSDMSRRSSSIWPGPVSSLSSGDQASGLCLTANTCWRVRSNQFFKGATAGWGLVSSRSCAIMTMTSSSRPNVSSSPSQVCQRRRGACNKARQPCPNVRRHAARLPLSTVETYRGGSGARLRVSYQFIKWPRYRSSFSMLSKVARSRVTRSNDSM